MRGLAAVVAAGVVLASAGQAGAVVMDGVFSGFYTNEVTPVGFDGSPGGDPWSVTIRFDTERGIISPDGTTFSWTAGSGILNPIWQGYWNGLLGLQQPLANAQSLLVRQTDRGPELIVTGFGFSLSILEGAGQALVPLVGITQASQNVHDPAALGGSTFVAGDFTLGGDRGLSARLSVAPVPEPSTWALLLMAFGSLGWVLRKRRHGGGGSMVA